MKKITLLTFLLITVFLIPVHSFKIVDSVPFIVKWLGAGILEVGSETSDRKLILYKKNYIFDYKFSGLTYEVKFKRGSVFFREKTSPEWNLWLSKDLQTRHAIKKVQRPLIQNIPKLDILVNTQKNKVLKVTQSNQQTGTFSANLRNIKFSNLVKQFQPQTTFISFRTSSSNVFIPGKIVYRGGNIVGDINHNGQVDKTDYILLSSYLGTKICNSTYDINGDGKFDWTDIKCMKKIYMSTVGNSTGGGNPGGNNTGGGNTGGGNTGGGNTGGGNTGGGNTGGGNTGGGNTGGGNTGGGNTGGGITGIGGDGGIGGGTTGGGGGSDPIAEIIPYNAKKLNPQSWSQLGVNEWQGRVIYKAKLNDTKGWTPVGKWKWKVTWDNFTLGKLPDHNETWGINDENRKVGGRFRNLQKCWIKFELSRDFTKGAGQSITLTWIRTFKPTFTTGGGNTGGGITGIGGDGGIGGRTTGGGGGSDPIAEIIPYNAKKLNPQSWSQLGVNKWPGRVIYKARLNDTKGWTPVGKWKWKVTWDNFTLGKLPDHNETWGTNDENRKVGGRFRNLQKCWIKFELSRDFTKGAGQSITLTWIRTFKPSFTTGRGTTPATSQKIYKKNGIEVQKHTDTSNTKSLKVIKGTELVNLPYSENSIIVAAFTDGTKYDIVIAKGGNTCIVTQQ